MFLVVVVAAAAAATFLTSVEGDRHSEGNNDEGDNCQHLGFK